MPQLASVNSKEKVSETSVSSSTKGGKFRNAAEQKHAQSMTPMFNEAAQERKPTSKSVR